MSTLDILDLVDADEAATMPALLSQDELLDLHGQLLAAAADRGSEYRRAASLIATLSGLLEGFDDAAPRTVSLVLTGLVQGLRLGWLRPGEDVARFADADSWLSHLRIQRRAERAGSRQ